MSIFAALLLVAQGVVDLSAPPLLRESACRCPQSQDETAPVIRGLAIDGVVLLDASGRNPLPRQATVFRVLSATGVEAATPFRVWHMAASERCGVGFDYGRLYSLRLRKVGDEYETDRCLVEPVKPPQE